MLLLDRKPITFDSFVRLGITALLFYGFIWLLGYLSDVLIPFAVALLLAYLINPLVTAIQKLVGHRVPAVLLSLFVIITGLVLLGWLLIPMIFGEIADMGSLLTRVVTESEWTDKAARRIPPNLWALVKDYAARDDVRQLFMTDNFMSFVQMVIRKLVPGVWGLITGTASLILGFIGLAIILLYLVFLLIDFQRFRHDWSQFVPPPYRHHVVEFVHDFNQAMKRHFRAQAAIAAIVGVLFATGFAIIGLPMGILFGLFVGLLNMVPYLQVLSIPLAIILGLFRALETGSGFWLNMGLVALVYIIVQSTQDYFLVPRIQGKTTGFSPAMILLSLSIWGKLLGLLGLLLALPMTFLIIAYYKRFLAMAEEKISELEEVEGSPPTPSKKSSDT